MSTVNLPDWNPMEPPPVPVRRFTVDEYRHLIDVGVLDDDGRFELLEGWIVPKMVRNPPHEVAIDLAHDAIRAVLPAGWRLRIQSTVTTPDSLPEPDLAVIRGGPRDFLDRLPGPADVALVIEVADSSLSRGRGIKRRLYARAAIPAYWIVDLIDRQVEVYDDPTGPAESPTYRRRRDFGPDEAVPLVLDGVELGPIAVRDLLP